MMKFTQFHISLIFIILFTRASSGIAQNFPPGSDIFLASLDIFSENISIGTPKNITDRIGYDNQPAFTLDGKGFLYSSYRENGQTDIFRYDIGSDTSYSLTSTPESEYSPTPQRGDLSFSTVRVEMDGAQRLWKFNLDGSNPSVLLDSIFDVGYHGWGSDSTLGLFIVGTPNSFILVNIEKDSTQHITDNPGRSIHKVPGENSLSFVHKTTEDEWWIKQVDLKSRLITSIIRTLPGSEDYVWTSTGTLLMANKSSLYKFDPKKDNDWVLIRSFSLPGLQNIKRIAISPNDNYLLLVSGRIDDHSLIKSIYPMMPNESSRFTQDRTAAEQLLRLPRNLWTALYFPLGKLVVWAEEVDLQNNLIETFLNDNRTAGFYPNATLGGATGASIGGILFHNDLFKKNIQTRIEVLFNSPENFTSTALLEIPLGNGGRKVFGSINHTKDNEEDFFIGQETLDYLGTNLSDFKTHERDYGYEQLRAEAKLDIKSNPQSRGIYLSASADYTETTVDQSKSDDEEPIPTNVPGFGEVKLSKYSTYFGYNARNHAANPYAGWSIGFSGFRSVQIGGDEYKFKGYSIEIQKYFNLYNNDRILVFRIKIEEITPIEIARIPFYSLSTLGTSETLRGFERSRFRDKGSFLFNIEYRYPIWDTLDGVIFYDIGEVYSERNELRFDALHTSVGTGIRIRTKDGFVARLQIGVSSESVRGILKFTQVF